MVNKFVCMFVCLVFCDEFVHGEKKNAKIMSGLIAHPRQFPYMVSIQYLSTGQHFCGGVIINSHHILTAAHCMYPSLPKLNTWHASQLQVQAGITNLTEIGKIARVRKIFIHNFYEERSLDNDIAILRLAGRGIRFSTYIQPAILSTGFISSKILNNTCTILGWGHQCGSIIKKSLSEQRALNGENEAQSMQNLPNLFKKEMNTSISNWKANNMSIADSNVETFMTSSTEIECVESFPEMLRYAQIPIQNSSECDKDYRYADITDNLICAGNRGSRIDSCKGDSGGPLVCNGKIEGIVSFGDGCDNWNHLGVYTRVYYHLPWINMTLKSFTCNLKSNNYFVIYLLLMNVFTRTYLFK